jgi:hypothetical protein
MKKFHSRVVASAGAAMLVALAVCVVQPSAAQAMPPGCSGPDAPPQCGHLPPAPPVDLGTPSFKPAGGLTYVWVSMAVDPSVVSGYPGGSALPYRAYFECSSGFTDPLPLTLSSDRHTITSSLDGWWLAPGQTCTVVTDSSSILGLSRASVRRESADSSPTQTWFAAFS